MQRFAFIATDDAILDIILILTSRLSGLNLTAFLFGHKIYSGGSI